MQGTIQCGPIAGNVGVKVDVGIAGAGNGLMGPNYGMGIEIDHKGCRY